MAAFVLAARLVGEVAPPWHRVIVAGLGLAVAMTLLGAMIGKRVASASARAARVHAGQLENLRQGVKPARPASEILEQRLAVRREVFVDLQHVTRTPMNGVIGMLELALDTDLTDLQRDQITTAYMSAESLIEIINDVTGSSSIESGRIERPRRAIPPRPATTDSKSLNVLVAEDNIVNQKVARGFLEREGHRVTIAQDGQEAADAAAQSDFDVILMDVQMPTLGGFEATRLIRDWEALVGGHVAIVALTALAGPGDREACLAAGMDGYLSKPLRADALFAAIDGLVTHTRLIDVPTSTPGAASDDVFDAAALAEILGGDRDLLVEIAAAFLGEVPKQMAAMREAVNTANPGMLLEAAHSMKGAAATITANKVAAIAREIESMGRAGNAGAATHLSKLDDALAELRGRLMATGERT